MIEVVVVAGREVRNGIRRLLESEGDIRVVASADSLDGVDLESCRDAIVVGPGAAFGPNEWRRLVGSGWTRVVLLAPLPGWRRYPTSIVQVPMELTGHPLRGAVRESAVRSA